MRALAAEADREGRVYFTGGATAVLLGWRHSTIDVDLRFEPEMDRLLRVLPRLKDELQINIELASPADFIPVAPGWEERSLFIAAEGQLSFFHFDPYAQALAKVERGHTQDLEDVRAMIRMKLVDPSRAVEYFRRIEPDLYRYPAVDPPTFRRAVEEIFTAHEG
ncbi:MAG: DUF6036 family nucleotidyltransferase [Armatimonadota bacterium]|nr:DUF6036 family nucleotidyltransferase [Armatimonadota bacterium]MDR7451958.1 DUF6036 family nucleotidyltransferase [Armatimonadota bacterium]MDR7466640.1 DUF6036 family nucleotidyltransferase [Armatimonadota bacterium]MDR7498662.1 DUF6036 family nucleotidyltransferase [Armatimonadota bacterium]MDR7504626.1 DUF6036 family nucleotidyltransferase [Armatimonadota bacterium]